MSIDELGRAAAHEALRRAANGVDSMTMLKQLKRTNRVRATGSALAVVGVCVAIVAVIITTHDSGNSTPVRPANSTTPTPTVTCALSVECLGARQFRIDLPVPVTVTAPANFGRNFTVIGSQAVEDYRNDVYTTGVTIMEDAVPMRYDATWTRDSSAGTTADSMAHWLAHRPFLTDTHITQVTISGRQGWRVTADLKPGAPTPAQHGDGRAAPTFSDLSAQAGYRTNLGGEYVLVDVPGAGVTVIWSWSLSHGSRAIVTSRSYVNTLSFG